MKETDKEFRYIRWMNRIKQADVPSYACIAYVVLLDNAMLDGFKAVPEWMAFAEEIALLIPILDEAQFTLYDYLDAALNGARNWKHFADGMSGSEDRKEKTMRELIEEAERKRLIYNGR